MTTFEKLKKKILSDTGYVLEKFERQYIGKHQRNAGAFRWTAKIENGGTDVGSEWAANVLLKMERIVMIKDLRTGEYIVYPK